MGVYTTFCGCFGGFCLWDTLSFVAQYMYGSVRFVSRVLWVCGVSGLNLDNHLRKHVRIPDK